MMNQDSSPSDRDEATAATTAYGIMKGRSWGSSS